MPDFNHEIALFEAANVNQKHKHSLSLYVIITLIILASIVSGLNQELFGYGIIIIVILCVIMLLFIHKNKRIVIKEHKQSFQAFVEIFYPAMLKNNHVYQASQFHIRAPYDMHVSSRIIEDMLDDHVNNLHVASLMNASITVDIIDISAPHKQSIRKCILTIPFRYDDAFECRSYIKPRLSYKYYQRLRGYDFYYQKMTRQHPFISTYEALRVFPDIDQLDMTYRDQMMVLSFKLTTSFKDLNTGTNKKNLMRHQMFLDKTFACIHHIQQTLKETYHEN